MNVLSVRTSVMTMPFAQTRWEVTYVCVRKALRQMVFQLVSVSKVVLSVILH